MNDDPPSRDRLFGATVLRLSFELKNGTDDPGFRYVYKTSLRDLGLSDDAVVRYIADHREELERHIRSGGKRD